MLNDSEEVQVVDEQVEEVEQMEEEQVVDEVQAHEDNIEDLKKRLATTTAQKNHFKEQLDKRQALQTSTRASLAPADLVAIMNAQIHEEDMERVERFAISEGITIREAVRHPELKAMLDVRNEQRNTAIATNIENVRRGNVKITDDELVQRASNGKIPESDDEIERLIHAKLRGR